MKLLVALMLAFSAILSVHANQDASDAGAFAEKYFDAWGVTQLPQAKPEDIERYLGSHMEYQSSLTGQFSGFNVVVIKYKTYVKGKHPQTGEVIEKSSETVEVLELENGKVSVIRKYSE